MLDILLYISGVLVGWHLGSSYQAYAMRTALKSLLNEIDVPKNNTSEIKVKVEEVNNVLYIYDSETDEFICQGNTIDEAAENFSKRKGIVSASLTHNNTTVCVIDGKVIGNHTK